MDPEEKKDFWHDIIFSDIDETPDIEEEEEEPTEFQKLVWMLFNNDNL